MDKLWNLLTLYDKILIVLLLLGSVFFIVLPLIGLTTEGNNLIDGEIVIQSSGIIQARIPLSDTYGDKALRIEIAGPIGTSIVEAFQGRVRMFEAPESDPEKICEKTGWIDQPGPMIICVPNQISIWIEAAEPEFDGVSW
ncbi:NusG domain II-containing protein [Iocasia frigidifontis]|uniref:NusG domain II-containing protein n=1 Tax=Iocasia fonsfrigidae TaxID=2682810 RepID=A0A8A7KHA0_9FIRM|nr:NusG domain II-containing protein [Iocasia fonsfrigidae]QTL97252.1 NusG domain II-containing protein [Iocasia fonsfrigidae]